jgi:3,4-dihydroxy 2-butanone 4-phosphate synthase/GTP cyclohydrolase II
MARLPDLVEFAQTHQLKIGTISDLIHYRAAHESLVEKVHERTITTAHGAFRAIALRDKPTGSAHLALVKGIIHEDRETLVRVHEPLSVLDLLETSLSTHSFSVSAALQAIAEAEQGVLVLLNCNEPAERMFSQFKAMDDVERLGEQYLRKVPHAKMDLRTYGIGAQILRLLNVGKMRLLANPRKMPSMAGFDLQVAGYFNKENT